MSNKTITICGFICKIISIALEILFAVLSISREFFSNYCNILNSKGIYWTIITIIFLAGIFQGIVWYLEKDVAKRLNEVTTENIKLKNENEQIYIFKNNTGLMLTAFLREIAHNLNFSNDDRISLYIILDSNFALCGRVAYNPNFAKSGRSGYPLNEGVIGYAWQHKSHFENNIPQYSHGNSKYQSYQHKEYHLSLDVINNLTMKSHLYYAYRLNEYDNTDPKGVIVIESINPHRFKENELLKTLESIEPFLYQMIKMFHEHIPALKRAQQEEGF